MVTQKVDRLCHMYGELYDENDHFCVKCNDKSRSTVYSEGNSGLKESKRPKSLDKYIKEKGKERGFFKPMFLQNANKSSKSNRKASNLREEVVINVVLIEGNEKGSRVAIKIAKRFSSIKVARVAVKKHADHDQFFCRSDEYVLCYPHQSIVQFIPRTNIEVTVERYKKEIGKPYSKIDLYLCNVRNADSDVHLKVIDDDKATIHGNSNQTISNQITHEPHTKHKHTITFEIQRLVGSEAKPFQ